MTEHVPASWRAAGACVSADPELFFPISAAGKGAAQIAEAQRICGCCQVRRQCLDFAMDTGETAGIWGGTTPEERIRARREKAVRRDPEPESPDSRTDSPEPGCRSATGQDWVLSK